MPTYRCGMCSSLIKPPLVVLELSEVVAGRARLSRSLLCPACSDRIRSVTHAKLLSEPGQSSDWPDPPLRQVMR